MVKLLEMGALNSLGTGSTATFLAAINVIMLNNSSLTAPCKKWARSHKLFFFLPGTEPVGRAITTVCMLQFKVKPRFQ